MLRWTNIRLAAVHKKSLRLKCTDCRRLLPSEHFNHTATVLHGADKLICLSCKKYCVHCGQLQPRTLFSSQNVGASLAMTEAQKGTAIPVRSLLPTSTESVGHSPLPELADEQDWCSHCVGKRHAAETNVFFRFPVLRYRTCPFSADRYREILEEEQACLRRTGPYAHRDASAPLSGFRR